MMIKNDFYMIFQNKEYRIDKLENTEYELISWDSIDQTVGFIRNTPTSSAYVKKINAEDFGEVYSIHTFGIYKGLKFPIDMERDDQYMLSTNKAEIAEKLDFYNINKSEFEKWVDKKDIEHIYEIKELIPDFFD